jgi:hypothetical protein
MMLEVQTKSSLDLYQNCFVKLVDNLRERPFNLKGGGVMFFFLKKYSEIRDRPFNFEGGVGYGFLFRSELFFRTTQELEYFFFCRAKREFSFQNGKGTPKWKIYNELRWDSLQNRR